jgi:hypothetical protein
MARKTFVPFAPVLLAMVATPLAAAVNFLKTEKKPGANRQKIAFAAFVTGLEGAAWEDATAVLAHGIHQAGLRSRNQIEAIVLAPDTLPGDIESKLIKLGFDKVVKRPPPFQLSEIQYPLTKKELAHVQGQGTKGASFSLIEECIKYHALTLTDYDRVLILDLDTMILNPMDAMMDVKEDLVGTYDVAMEGKLGNVVPVVQGGFLLVRPNKTDFELLQKTTREGTFNGAGWQDSHIGFAYGGVGPQGLLSYHFHKELPLATLQALPADSQEKRQLREEVDPELTPPKSISGKRFLALDRRAYDVLDTEFTHAELKGEDTAVTLQRIKSVHFTGGCGKPWSCQPAKTPLCQGMTDAWWTLRSSLATKWGVPDTARCKAGELYTPLDRPADRAARQAYRDAKKSQKEFHSHSYE